MKSKITSIVYEAPTIWDRFFIHKCIKQNIPVWLIEPFHAYHHNNKSLKFYPPAMSSFAEDLIKRGRISVIRADDIEAKDIYGFAAENAVAIVESVYPFYRERRESLINCATETLKSLLAENVFKHELCNSLAEFYSFNILLNRIEKKLGGEIFFYPAVNIYSYCEIKKLLKLSGHEYYEHTYIHFPLKSYMSGVFENIKANIIDIVHLSAQTFASGISAILRKSDEVKEKKKYKYGISINSPRQLSSNKRGPGLIIDNNKIRENEVVYFPQIDLTDSQKDALNVLSGNVFALPQPKRFFPNFHEWVKLLKVAVEQNLLNFCGEIRSANVSFFNYFRWKNVLEKVDIRHFITHCDFGISHISRNIALNQAGVQTWYFTDSMNHFNNFQEDLSVFNRRHPFWTYLCYDNFVTWSAFIADYFKSHSESFNKTHIVGCLWSEHIVNKLRARQLKVGISSKEMDNKFIIAVYDTTYSRNSFTSYLEGIAFAEHILRLTDEFYSIHILFKEKKDRNIHSAMDPANGQKLLNLYNLMSEHPNITFYSDQDDSSLLMSLSDMVISFPFTSTTFEALSVNKPAIWHDSMGLYRNTPYGKTNGITTHTYEELKNLVTKIKNLGQNEYKNPIPTSSPLLDPYRDGKAIERFRDLLISN